MDGASAWRPRLLLLQINAAVGTVWHLRDCPAQRHCPRLPDAAQIAGRRHSFATLGLWIRQGKEYKGFFQDGTGLPDLAIICHDAHDCMNQEIVENVWDELLAWRIFQHTE